METMRKRKKTSSQALFSSVPYSRFDALQMSSSAFRNGGRGTTNIKTFALAFIVIYVVISLPAMLGIGYVIDWIPEASVFQKIKGYTIEGLANNYLFNSVVSGIISVLIQSYFYKGWKQ